MTLSSFKNYISFEKRFSPHTVKAYEADIIQALDYLRETFELTELSEVRHPHLRSWLVDLVRKKQSARSINRKISSVRAYFKFLLRRGEILTNPTKRLKALKLPKRLPVYLQESETELLLSQDFISSDNRQDSFSHLRDHIILQTLYVSGMRRSELINLKEDDIDFTGNSYRVTGKGGKIRLVPFSDKHKDDLQKYLQAKHDLFEDGMQEVFVTDKGSKLYPKFVYNLVSKRVGNISSLGQRGPHTLRHTFATHLANGGADLNAIKDLLGHTSLSATQIYTHNSIEKLKLAYSKAHPKAG